MENSLLLSAVWFTIIFYVLPWLPPLNRNIALRLISGLLSIFCAIVIIADPFFYVGFGSTNVITYATSQAGDPARKGDLYFGLTLSLLGFIQFLYAFFLINKWAFSELPEGETPERYY